MNKNSGLGLRFKFCEVELYTAALQRGIGVDKVGCPGCLMRRAVCLIEVTRSISVGVTSMVREMLRKHVRSIIIAFSSCTDDGQEFT